MHERGKDFSRKIIQNSEIKIKNELEKLYQILRELGIVKLTIDSERSNIIIDLRTITVQIIDYNKMEFEWEVIIELNIEYKIDSTIEVIYDMKFEKFEIIDSDENIKIKIDSKSEFYKDYENEIQQLKEKIDSIIQIINDEIIPNYIIVKNREHNLKYSKEKKSRKKRS